MAEIASRRLAKPIEYEISIANVDKPALQAGQIVERLKAMDQSLAVPGVVWITRAATFAEKLALFPSPTFVVGADTIARIVEVRYYDGDPEKMQRAVRRLSESGCRFLVFGRVDQTGRSSRFQSLDQLALPDAFEAICDSVTESEFREDIASRDLR